jgi:hypothetical protein
MNIPYQSITIKEMCKLAEQGYECSCDADVQAVQIKRVGFPELVIKEMGKE